MSRRLRGWRSAGLVALIWLFSFTVYGLYFQGQWVYGQRPIIHITGDEPHYLLIATSLLRDGDLDMLNNYREKDYQPFYPYHLGDARDPEDMHALYGGDGRLYSKHGVGLPLALLPAMRLGGHGLAIVFMLAVTAAALGADLSPRRGGHLPPLGLAVRGLGGRGLHLAPAALRRADLSRSAGGPPGGLGPAGGAARHRRRRERAVRRGRPGSAWRSGCCPGCTCATSPSPPSSEQRGCSPYGASGAA